MHPLHPLWIRYCRVFKEQDPQAVSRFRSLVLPCIEAGLYICKRYVGDRRRLSCGITAFSGKKDNFVGWLSVEGSTGDNTPSMMECSSTSLYPLVITSCVRTTEIFSPSCRLSSQLVHQRSLDLPDQHCRQTEYDCFC